MREERLGPLRLVMESRGAGSGGGPTLRVYDPDGHERLRFDCFERGAHWHSDPGGRNEVTSLAGQTDPLAWTLAELRRDLDGYLKQAGYPCPDAIDPPSRAAALDRVEQALRVV